MVSIQILVIALVPTSANAAAHTMKGGGLRCPCVTYEEMAVCSHKCTKYGDCIDSTFDTTAAETLAGKGVKYPANYGAVCGVHIEPGYASCYNLTTAQPLPKDNSSGTETKVAKTWCHDPWCFVSPCTCNVRQRDVMDMMGTWAGSATSQNGDFTIGQDKATNQTGMVWAYYSYENCNLSTVDTWLADNKVTAVDDDEKVSTQKATWERQYGPCGNDANPSFEPALNCARRAKCGSSLTAQKGSLCSPPIVPVSSTSPGASAIGATALGFILASSLVHAEVLASL